jgi:hypothetical protein
MSLRSGFPSDVRAGFKPGAWLNKCGCRHTIADAATIPPESRRLQLRIEFPQRSTLSETRIVPMIMLWLKSAGVMGELDACL